MKKLVLCFSISLLAASWAHAELKIPSSVFTMEELEEAKAEAMEKEEPLIFVYTDPGSTWVPCLAASSEAFKIFRSTGVLILADDYASLPEAAKAARKNAGSTIPMVLVTTANGEREIEGISYDRLKEDMRDTNRELKKKLETVDVLGTGEVPAEGETAEGSGNAPAAAMKPEGLLSDSQVWSNTDGKEITAAVKSVAAGTVVFVINGNEVPYPLSNLSPESRAAIESLAAE